MKKGKSITFQLLDPAEKSLFDYCNTIHNFSGTMKRLLMNSEGFKKYQAEQAATKQVKPVIRATESAGIKIKIGG